MGFPRQEHCSGLPFPHPGDLPDPEIKPGLMHWQAVFTAEPPEKPGRGQSDGTGLRQQRRGEATTARRRERW